MKNQRGFTLLELLVVVGIIGLLAGLAIVNYKTYTSKATYAVALRTVGDARTSIEGSLTVPDAVFPSLNYSQSSQGALTDPTAKAFMPTFRLPRNTKVEITHDPSCDSSACVAQMVQVRHCSGKDFPRLVQYGDGLSIVLEHVAGSGCP